MRLKSIVAVALVTAIVAAPTAVWAAHQFNDVGDTHPFHAEISTMANAGIVGGFPDGTFRPSSAVTRQAAAAFLERAVSRAGIGEGSASLSPGASVGTAGQVALTSGAALSGSGFALVQANAYAFTFNPAACPCALELQLLRDGGFIESTFFDIGPGNENGYGVGGATVTAMVPMAAGATSTFSVRAALFDTNVSGVTVRGTVAAQYVPLSADGDNTL